MFGRWRERRQAKWSRGTPLLGASRRVGGSVKHLKSRHKEKRSQTRGRGRGGAFVQTLHCHRNTDGYKDRDYSDALNPPGARAQEGAAGISTPARTQTPTDLLSLCSSKYCCCSAVPRSSPEMACEPLQFIYIYLYILFNT